MADIALRALYDQKAREFGTQGAGLARFDADFIDATNRAINRINRGADLSTRITRVDDLNDEVTGLDEDYEDVLSDGISLNLMLMGRRPPKGAEAIIQVLESRFSGGIAEIFFENINDQQNADTDDDTYDIFGLGKLG